MRRSLLLPLALLPLMVAALGALLVLGCDAIAQPESPETTPDPRTMIDPRTRIDPQIAFDPQTATDLHVYPSDDLVAAVGAAPEGSRIHLHPGPNGTHVYSIGAAVLSLPSGATIRGPTAERGPLGEIVAPVAIRGNGPRIFDQRGREGWTIEHLDISGARWVGDDNLDGTCISRGEGTLRYVKIHDCDNRGLGGWAGLLEYAELTDNSARRIAGHSAASKSMYLHTIRHSYVHGNHFNALWTDCDNAGWTVEDTRVVDNYGTGIFNEISRGPSVLRRNLVQRNNLSGGAGRAGVVITSSTGVQVEANVLTDNGIQDLRIWEDRRAGRGAAGCTSGYRTRGVILSGNTIGSAVGTDLPGVVVR